MELVADDVIRGARWQLKLTSKLPRPCAVHVHMYMVHNEEHARNHQVLTKHPSHYQQRAATLHSVCNRERYLRYFLWLTV